MLKRIYNYITNFANYITIGAIQTVTEAYIPENKKSGFLLKLWNNKVAPFHRNVLEHRHLQFEIVLFKSGHGIYTTNSGTHDIEAGDIFVFPSNEQHCITDILDGEDFKFMNIHFEPQYVISSKSGFSPENSNVCFSHNRYFCNRLPRNNPHTEKIKSLILEIEQEFEQKSAEFELMIHNKIYEILVVLVRNLNYGGEKAVTPEEYRKIKTVRKVMDYVNQHLSEELTLSILAEFSDLSPNYLSAMFKSTVGVSLWDYITSRRIEHACVLLKDRSDLTMLEIAELCGFNNSANFNKTFRKITGMTPRDYRRHGEYIG